jgi:hypothetical protein
VLLWSLSIFCPQIAAPVSLQSSVMGEIAREDLMLKKCFWSVALVTSVACGTQTATEVAPNPYLTSGDIAAAEAPQFAAVEVAELRPYGESDGLAVLPEAPWSGALVPASSLPETVATALESAENRSWCAPMVPASAGEPARAATLAGGWSLEFDQRGAPGVRANGNSCIRCGRAAFGVAGTSMGTDEAVDFDEEAPIAMFNDGSTQDVVAEDGVASATLTVGGQGCVYQVWSFLGEDHLNSLLEELRFVELETATDSAVASH